MSDTVRLTCGAQPQRFPFNVPGATASTSTTANSNSAPIPKDGVYATYLAYVTSTAGAVSATMTFYATNDPHTAGADDLSLGTRNNFVIGTTNASTTITSSEGLFRSDMDGDEVYAQGVAVGTTMTYVSATSATLSATASATATVPARFQALNWVLLATVTLSGTRHASDGFATASAWRWARVVVSSLTGTGATAFAIQGN